MPQPDTYPAPIVESENLHWVARPPASFRLRPSPERYTQIPAADRPLCCDLRGRRSSHRSPPHHSAASLQLAAAMSHHRLLKENFADPSRRIGSPRRIPSAPVRSPDTPPLARPAPPILPTRDHSAIAPCTVAPP